MKFQFQQRIFTQADMSGNLSSETINLDNVDNVCIQHAFTGTPTGTFFEFLMHVLIGTPAARPWWKFWHPRPAPVRVVHLVKPEGSREVASPRSTVAPGPDQYPR